MRNYTIITAICGMFLASCASQRVPVPDIEYMKIPEGYLQECVLPEMPALTAELSDAFVQAYQCGEQGNRDKQRIRKLTQPEI